jgi:hypothetical protein
LQIIRALLVEIDTRRGGIMEQSRQHAAAMKGATGTKERRNGTQLERCPASHTVSGNRYHHEGAYALLQQQADEGGSEERKVRTIEVEAIEATYMQHPERSSGMLSANG